MSNDQNKKFYLQVHPHNYEDVNWKHQTFKNSYGTWHVYIDREEKDSFYGSIILKGSRGISMADMKVSLTFYGLTRKYKSTINATFDSEQWRFFFYHRLENPYKFYVSIKVDASLCSHQIEDVSVPTSKIIDHSKKLFESGKFADVIIKTKDEGKEIKAHQCFLSRSDVIDTMFNANMKEAEEKVIEITDIDYDVLLEMIRYLYCDEVPKMKEMALELLVAGDKYNIQGLVDECGAYLLQNVTMENHGIILATADQLNITSLKEVAIDFVVENRKEIFATESWKELKKNNMSLAMEIMEKNMSIS